MKAALRRNSPRFISFQETKIEAARMLLKDVTFWKINNFILTFLKELKKLPGENFDLAVFC